MKFDWMYDGQGGYNLADIPPIPITKTEPWDHQRVAFWWTWNRPGTMLAMDVGTGKSKVVVDIVVNAEHDKTLVLCPKHAMGVWPREFAIHGDEHIEVLRLRKGTVKNRTEKANNAMREDRSGQLVIVINLESAWRDPFKTWSRKKFDCIVIDEIHRIKAPGGRMSKYADLLGKESAQKIGLTGTPMPHTPLDLYAQFRFLDKRVFGTNYNNFASKYAIMGGFAVNGRPVQIMGYQNKEDIARKFQSISFHVDQEILDLPDSIHTYRSCELDNQEQRVYDELEKEFISILDGSVEATLESILMEAGNVATASNSLVLATRLQQITSGFVRDDDGEDVTIGSSKRDLLKGVMEDLPWETGRGVVIFCRFVKDLEEIKQIADELGLTYGELSGRRRDAIDDNARMSEGIDIAGIQIQSGSASIDLTRSNVAIYYSITFSLEHFDQSIGRLRRSGQEREVTFIHLMAENTIDEKIYRVISKRREAVHEIRDLAVS